MAKLNTSSQMQEVTVINVGKRLDFILAPGEILVVENKNGEIILGRTSAVSLYEVPKDRG